MSGHRLAMIDGYGAPFGATAPDVEATIRSQIQFLIGVAIPPVLLLQIGKYNWRDAVNGWQQSLDTWWSSDLTNTVRQHPDRLQSWVDMGSRLLRQATEIGKSVGDDGLVRLFTDYGKALGTVVHGAVDAAGNVVRQIVPWWVWAVVAGVGLLYISPFLPRSRR
jgi:hypothetical protein